MCVSVKVKPNSRKPGVEKTAPNELVVKVNAPPVEGKANAAVVQALAEYFGVPRSQVKLISGEKGKQKWFEIG